MRLQEDWEFNVLGIYNYRKRAELRNYFDYIAENHDRIDGDILEAGVYKGRSLLATGLLLKELGSDKRVYGFDSFSGFPPIYHQFDELRTFDLLLQEGRISSGHYEKIQRNLNYRSHALPQAATLRASNVSLSGDFSRVSIEELRKKIDFLGLDNVILVSGPFADTLTEGRSLPERLMAVLMDCDLYESYRVALPFIWNRLAIGGYLYLDEYYSLKFPGARIATDEFFASKDDRPQRHIIEPGDFERWYVRRLST
jgi:hypothetical protein